MNPAIPLSIVALAMMSVNAWIVFRRRDLKWSGTAATDCIRSRHPLCRLPAAARSAREHARWRIPAAIRLTKLNPNLLWP